MVQYVFTPWRDRQELLLVRDQFYGSEALTRADAAGGAASLSRIQGGRASGRRVEEAAYRDAYPEQKREGEGLNQGDAGRTTAAANDCQTSSREQGGRDEQHKAVGRVSMWMQRGNCPHMVESTALLMAAVLSDEAAAAGNAGASTYAVRAAYAAAFSR